MCYTICGNRLENFVGFCGKRTCLFTQLSMYYEEARKGIFAGEGRSTNSPPQHRTRKLADVRGFSLREVQALQIAFLGVGG